MDADIKLDGQTVVVEGTHIKTRAHDLELDSAARRRSSRGWRRALVHDFRDGLTINYNNDYPGGVTVKGALRTDSLHTDSLSADALRIEDYLLVNTCYCLKGADRLMVFDFNPGIGLAIGDNQEQLNLQGTRVTIESGHVGGPVCFDEPITAPDITVRPRVTPDTETDPACQPFNLHETIRVLEERISFLERQMDFRNDFRDLERRVDAMDLERRIPALEARIRVLERQ